MNMSLSQGAYPPMKEEIWKPSVIEDGVRASIAEEVAFLEAPLRKAMTREFGHIKLVEELLLILKIVND